LLFREPALLHDFLSPLEAILSSFNWSENHRAGHRLVLSQLLEHRIKSGYARMMEQPPETPDTVTHLQ
ncbi:hypothetical protein, partial [Burkholderia gladioli]